MNDKIKDIVVTLVFLFTIISLFLINVIKKDTDISIAERRELATMLYERIAGVKLTMDFSPTVRASVACCLLCVFSLSLYHEQGDMRRGRRTRVERIERTGRYGGKT